MKPKYSKSQFDEYTHRFKVKFKVGNPFIYDANMDIYSDSDSYQMLGEFISEKKSDKVVSFEIVHRASKEQDEASSKFIDEILGSL